MTLRTTGFFLFLFIIVRPVAAGSEEPWTLKRCVNYALEHNPDLKSAEARIKGSEFNLEYQKTQFLPRVDMNAATGYLNGESISPHAIVGRFTEEGLQNRNESGQYGTAGLTFSAPIVKEGVLFSKDAPSISIAESQLSVDRRVYEAGKNEIISAIGSSYFSILKTTEEIRADEEHIKSLTVDVDTAKGKFREGLISRNDLLLSEVKLVSGEKVLDTNRNYLKTLIVDLVVRLGMDPEAQISVADDGLVLPYLLSVDKLIAAAVAGRPEIKAQELRITMARQDVRRAESQKYPNVDFVSNMAVGSNYSSHNSTLFLGAVQMNVPVFDFGGNRAKVESLRAKIADEESVLASLRGKLAQEVITVYTDVGNARAEIKMREKMIEQAEEAARLARGRFKQNLVPLSEVLNAEYEVLAQKKALAQAKYDIRIGYLRMERATGSSAFAIPQQ